MKGKGYSKLPAVPQKVMAATNPVGSPMLGSKPPKMVPPVSQGFGPGVKHHRQVGHRLPHAKPAKVSVMPMAKKPPK